jgi:phosphoribosylanthranilate isomerase
VHHWRTLDLYTTTLGSAAAPLDVVQLHGRESAGDFPHESRVWKAVRVADGFDPASLDQYPVEAVLLDGPSNGVVFDWMVASRAPRKIIIAGGLDAGNVRRAIEQAKPWGVDACSRLESAPGKKDHVKMNEFLKAALS